MGLFSKILDKLGVTRNDAAGSIADPRKTGLKVDSTSSSAPSFTPQQAATMTQVDVVAQLEEKARAHPEKLNWRTSIVDLLKLLDLDSSLSARKELANELGAPRELKDGSAEMNIWLHKTVLQRIAENGGNVPRDLLV
jgi:hypothetical protein